uniref:60S ribosomal export protein NMD3 n=1 Tax=Plectus sambesii TaxID=2011161 RepID=A0A914XE13_9BILA
MDGGESEMNYMEEEVIARPTTTRILCCECGVSIEPNPVNMCVGCVRSRVDITEGIPKTNQLFMCKFCDRYLQPPNGWIFAAPESKELLSLCLKRMKTTLTKLRLTDAAFIWTEPHCKRLKVKLTVQKEVLAGAILQQVFVVEFTVYNQMCDDCRRAEAKDFWRACVQVRQKCEFKKTMFYLEQLVLKHKAHVNTTGVKPVATGIDFFYPKLQDARKLVDFINGALPSRYQYAQELVTHDTKNNTYDYKHTFCIELVPICKDNVVCLPKKAAQQLGNMPQILVCFRVSSVVSLIDPMTGQTADVSSQVYFREPFEALAQSKQLVEFYVIDVEPVNVERTAGHGHISNKHEVADVWVMRSNEVGVAGADSIYTRTHLGHLLKPGDTVMGFDIRNCNANNRIFDEMPQDKVPDVVLVKKVFSRVMRQRRRKWKLHRLAEGGGNILPETASLENDYEAFLEDLEDDPVLRENVNIYKDPRKMAMAVETDDEDEDLPSAPTLQEMLDDLHLDDEPMPEAEADE